MIGVIQNQAISSISVKCMTSRKKTLRVASRRDRPATKIICSRQHEGEGEYPPVMGTWKMSMKTMSTISCSRKWKAAEPM